jgi:hypothetical protein
VSEPTTPPTTTLEARIAALFAEIPDEERAVFDQYYRQQFDRAIQQAGAFSGGLDPDPDQVEEELIEDLVRQADGRDDQGQELGLGAVPTNNGLNQLVPPERDPRTLPPATRAGKRRAAGKGGTGKGGMAPAQLAAWAGIGLAILIFCIYIFGGSSDAPTIAEGETTTTTPTLSGPATPTPLMESSGGDDVTVAYPSSLEIARDDDGDPQGATEVYRVLASASELGGTWEPDLEPGTAAWLNGTYINHSFCLPQEASPTVAALSRGDVITMRPASGAVRRYEVSRVRRVGRQQVEVLDQRRAGLTLILCGEAGNERTVVEAIYHPERTDTPVLGRGQAAVVPDLARLSVQTVQTMPPTGTFPTGYTEVALTVDLENLTSDVLLGDDIADQLEMDGAIAERLSTTHTPIDAHATGQAIYRYLVPEAGGSATWRATALTGESVSIALRIEPAPLGSPRTPYTATVDAASVRLVEERSGRRVTLTAQVTPSGPDAATLERGDVTVWVGGRSIALADGSSPLPVLVQAGNPTDLTIVAVLPDVSSFEIQIGQQRWRITLP